MRLRIPAMSGKIPGYAVELCRHAIELVFEAIHPFVQPRFHPVELCRHAIELVFEAIHPFIQPRVHPVDPFRQHLMTLDNQVQLVLNRFSEGSDMAGDHAIDLCKITFVHTAGVRSLKLAFGGGPQTDVLYKNEISRVFSE